MALRPIKIMTIGDSHTHGVVSNKYDTESGGYRFYLDQKLKAAGLSFDMVGRRENGPTTFDNDHEGHSGYQINALTPMVPAMMTANKPDVILLMAGNVDAKWDHISTMKTEMSQLIDKLSQHAPNAQILVAGIMPARPDNTAGAQPWKIAAFNAELPGIVSAKKAAGHKVKFVDTSAITVNDISSTSVDLGTHLSHAGASTLAGIWLNALKSFGIKDGTIDVNQGGTSGSGSTTPPPPTGGSGNSVTAVDDDMWKTDAGKTMWQNARYLTWNDKGGDGALKVTAVAAKSAAGASVSFASDGTITYRPVAGWQGKDYVEYTVADAGGSFDKGLFYVQVGTGSTAPAPTQPAPTLPPTGGSGNPVVAVDDDFWKTDAGKTMWQNARYLTWNDKGEDGGLKVTAVAAKSAAGANVSFASDGTIAYKPVAGWQGKDWVEYTVVDRDGSSDTGKFHVQVGTGTSTPAPSEPAPTPPSSGGTGNAVTAVDDHWNVKAGGTLWFNTRYALQNDKAPDGGLKIASIGSVSTKGGSISWDASTGTTIYKPKAGFVGKDSVAYTAMDADGSTDSAVINFDVLLA